MELFYDIEQRRQKEQVTLDSLKDSNERNRLGQFATPPLLASDIVHVALNYWKGRNEKIHFLDPGFGTGAFYSALRQALPISLFGSAYGIEIDPIVISVARSLWEPTGITLLEGDFTTIEPDSSLVKPNLIICNPPYIRHHHLKKIQKQYLQASVRKVTGLTISGLAGMYCYFLLLSHQWLSDGGLGIWLIPTEFMDVNYGEAIRDYLTKFVTILRVHRFESVDVQFADALVSSTVVFFNKHTPSPGHQAVFTVGGSLENPKEKYEVSIDWLSKQNKWSKQPKIEGDSSNGYSWEITMGDLF